MILSITSVSLYILHETEDNVFDHLYLKVLNV